MTLFFGEKSQQISVCELSAFGIKLSTRYGKASEMIELLQFAEAVAKAGLAHLLVSARYDSQAQWCEFAFAPGQEPQPGSPERQAILAAATQTIRQFVWFDTVFHGRDYRQLP